MRGGIPAEVVPPSPPPPTSTQSGPFGRFAVLGGWASRARVRWLTRECQPACVRVPASLYAHVDFRVRQAFRNKCPFLTEVRGVCSSNPGTAFDDDAFSQIRSFVRALHGRFGTLTAARDGVFCAVRRQTGIFSAKGAGRGATEAACAAESCCRRAIRAVCCGIIKTACHPPRAQPRLRSGRGATALSRRRSAGRSEP